MTLFHSLAFFLGATVAIDAAAKRLAADARLAMDRSGLTVDFVARTLGVPPNKLSLQLNGYLAFTYFCRFSHPEITEAGFWMELWDIQAERIGRAVMPRDLSALVSKVGELVNVFAGSNPRAGANGKVA